GLKDSFSLRQLYAARAVDGVQSARPIFAEWDASTWKNPQTRTIYSVQVLAVDPDQPVLLFPEIATRISELRQPDTAFADRRGRRFLGSAPEGTETELARRKVRIIGNFALGPDFTNDGTLIVSDRTFAKFFAQRPMRPGELQVVEFGVIKVDPHTTVADAQRSLQQALPPSVTVRTKAELIALETAFQNSVSPVGPIFFLGAVVGFAIGLMITYQILFTGLSDQMPQYATLKAMGYTERYLVSVVLQQSCFYALAGFLPALAVGALLFHVI